MRFSFSTYTADFHQVALQSLHLVCKGIVPELHHLPSRALWEASELYSHAGIQPSWMALGKSLNLCASVFLYPTVHEDGSLRERAQETIPLSEFQTLLTSRKAFCVTGLGNMIHACARGGWKPTTVVIIYIALFLRV